MNNYHIYEEVGRGKFSVVYKGRIKKSIKYVAVKSVERSRRRKLMNEVRIFHDLQHKNILRFYNWYETRNHLWIIFEYCAGGDLLQMIETDKRLPEDTVRKFGFELVEGLSYLHANGIIYADMKPSNVLLDEYGVLKFADFGLSKKITDFQGTQDSTAQANGATGSEAGRQKAGTPYYMAPELFQDNGVHSFYSDFWSLGCVLFELASGKPPFYSNSLKDLISMIVEGDSLPLDLQMSPDFNDLLKRMLERDPIKRINWEEIRMHPFWREAEFSKRQFPQQTQFDAYLRTRGIVPEHFYDQRNNPLVKKLGGGVPGQQTGPGGQGKVDIMRLSHNVRRNIKKEQDEDDSTAGNTRNNQQYTVSTGVTNTSGLNNQGHYPLQKQSSSSASLFPGGSSTPSSTTNNLPTVNPDDVSLNNNRRMVLNFGDRTDDDEPSTSPVLNYLPQQTSQPQQSSPLEVNNFMISKQQQVSPPSTTTTTTTQIPTYDLDNANFTQKVVEQTKLTNNQNLLLKQQTTTTKQQQQINFYSTTPPQPSQQIDEQDLLNFVTAGNQQASKNTKNVNNQAALSARTIQQQQQQQSLFSKTVVGNIQAQIPSLLAKPQNVQSLNTPQAQKDLMMLINQQVFTQSKQQDAQMQGAAAQKSVAVKTIDQLLMHNSDTAVKPIMGNKEIEKTTPQDNQQFDPSQLPFQPWTPDLVLAHLETPKIDPHLNELFLSLQQPHSTLQEKIAVLLYFESLIVNSQISNRLINSIFMTLLVKMLKTMKTPQLRVRICSVIGLLIRHSTVIDNEVAESEVCTVLCEVLMKETNERVRRKAVAALGEFMFYAATQLDDDQADPCWEIRDEAVNAIIKSLRVQPISPTEDFIPDETVVFYSVKTLENITAQSNSAGGRFATVESANYLLQIFLGIHTPAGSQVPLYQNENLRTSAAVALSHIVRLQPKLFPLIFNKITPRLFCYTLTEGSARVQQAFITVLNQALAQNIYPKINEILLRLLDDDASASGANSKDDQQDPSSQAPPGYGYLACLMRLLEHTSIVIRGKSLLNFLLLFKQDFRWMAIVEPEVKFFHVLDRLSRENYKYVQCCLLCLIEGIVDIIPLIFSAISEELNLLLNNGGNRSQPNIVSEFERRIHRSEFETLQQAGNMIYIAIILDLMQAQCVKVRIVNYGFIRCIATLIDNCQLQDGYIFAGAEEFLNALLLIVESISSNQKLLLQLSEPIINLILPVLLQKTRGESASGLITADIRFLSLKIFTDIVSQYLNDDTVYDPAKDNESISSGQTDPTTTTTRLLSDLLQQQLFPRLLTLLQDADPVPLFALKLLSAIVERNPPLFTRQLRKQEPLLLPLIAENYQVGHPRLNRHTINILKSLMASRELTMQEILQYRLAEKTHLLLKHSTKQNNGIGGPTSTMGDWCTEILLEVLQFLLTWLMEVVKVKESEVIKMIDEVLGCFDLCVQLLNTSNSQQDGQSTSVIVERSSQCLILMLQLYATCQNPQNRKREIYFTETHLNYLINALKAQNTLINAQPIGLLSTAVGQQQQADRKVIIKRILKCIYWALIQSEYQIRLKTDRRQLLDTLIGQLLAQSDDRSIQNTSKEINKILREQHMGTTPTVGGQMQQQQQAEFYQHRS